LSTIPQQLEHDHIHIGLRVIAQSDDVGQVVDVKVPVQIGENVEQMMQKKCEAKIFS
jgi:hypothetical protein